MLFKSLKDFENDSKRFLSWRNALKVLMPLLAIRLLWLIFVGLRSEKPMSCWEFIGDTLLEFVTPGISEIKMLFQYMITKIFPLFGNYWWIPHVLFILFLNFALNPMLRKVIFEKLFKKKNKEDK
jgi:hypothetical protein